MWLMTKHGFFSAVINNNNPTEVIIRARHRDHLEALKKRFPTSLKDAEILMTPTADYACRIHVEKRTWANIAGWLAAEIDYPNFKSEVHRARPDDNDYIAALHEVWSVMYTHLQRAPGKLGYFAARELVSDPRWDAMVSADEPRDEELAKFVENRKTRDIPEPSLFEQKSPVKTAKRKRIRRKK